MQKPTFKGRLGHLWLCTVRDNCNLPLIQNIFLCFTLKFSQIDVMFLTLYLNMIRNFFLFHDTHKFNINSNNNNNNNNDNDE